LKLVAFVLNGIDWVEISNDKVAKAEKVTRRKRRRRFVVPRSEW
jgi:hypothetical protein